MVTVLTIDVVESEVLAATFVVAVGGMAASGGDIVRVPDGMADLKRRTGD